MSVFTPDKDSAKLTSNFLDKNNPKSKINVCERISWPISEILKPFKKLLTWLSS